MALSTIFLAGKGKMAQELRHICETQPIHVFDFDPTEKGQYSKDPLLFKESAAVHFGSGRELSSLIEFCSERSIPLIQGSTNVKLPERVGTVVVNAPNLSIPIVKFLSTFPDFAKIMKAGMDVNIIESHQSQKQDTSGTARAIAKHLDIPEDKISKIRNQPTQLVMGVPREYLGGHAYHAFCFSGQGVEINVGLKVHGRSTYAEGTILVAKALLENASKEPEVGIYNNILEPGIHQLTERKTLFALGFLDKIA